jgi:hypothetical protein
MPIAVLSAARMTAAYKLSSVVHVAGVGEQTSSGRHWVVGHLVLTGNPVAPAR